MEALLGIVGIAVLWFVGNLLLRAVFRAGAAGVKSVATGKPLRDTLGGYFGPLEAELQRKNTEQDGSGLDYYSVRVRGAFPISRSTNLAFVTSVYDITGEEPEAVFSMMDEFQEAETRCFNSTVEIGEASPNQAFDKWVEVGRILPAMLQAPYGGERKFRALLRLVADSQVSSITYSHYNGPKEYLYWGKALSFTAEPLLPGYIDLLEEREATYKYVLQLGINVAMADGNLDDEEGRVLKEWVTKVLSSVNENHRDEMKSELNSVMKQTFASIKAGQHSKAEAIDHLNSLGDMSIKYDAIDLCYAVMAADGQADPAELELLNRLAEALELDANEVERIRDTTMLDLSKSGQLAVNSDEVLGIDPQWDKDETLKHLRQEFKKWNARLNSLPSGPEKDHAQIMLNAIADARNRHGR